MVRAALDGLQAGAAEVLFDDRSRTAKTALASDPAPFSGPRISEDYPQALQNLIAVARNGG